MGGGNVAVDDIADTVPLMEERLVGDSPAIGRNPFAGVIRPIGGERPGGLHNSNYPNPSRSRQ